MAKVFDPFSRRLITLPDQPVFIQRGYATLKTEVQQLRAQLGNAGVQTGTSTPASGTDGQLFYDTDDNTLYVWFNGSWNAISGGSPPSEDGYWDSTNTNWNSTTTNWDAV